MDYNAASEEILQLLGGAEYKPNAQNQKLADLGMVNMLTGGKGARGRVGGAMYEQAMSEREKGGAQKLTLARLTAEQKRWQAEQERMAADAERQARLDEQRLGLDRARLGIERDKANRERAGSWQEVEDPYTGEKRYVNFTTGDTRDAMGRPIGAGGGQGGVQPQPQAPQRPAPTSGSISGGAAAGAFGMPAPQVGGAQFAGSPTPQRPQPAQAPGGAPVSRVLFKDRPAVEAELQKTTAILRQLAGLEQLYGSSGGTGFGRGLSLPTKAAQQYDAGVAQLAPELFKMARTPGEGAQSDFEAKMKMMGMPYRVMPGDYTGVPENQLKGSQAELRRRLEERVQLLAAQLGLPQEEVMAIVEGTRAAPAQAGGQSQGGLEQDDLKYLGR